MKASVVACLLTLISIPVLAQDQSSCKAFFQVLQAQAGTPGLHVGLDQAQKKWWESQGKKKYPGLCMDGTVPSGDKPRFLVIWSTSKTVGPSPQALDDVYGQSASALQTAAHAERIYEPRWNLAQVTVFNVLSDGKLLLPAIYYETEDLTWDVFWHDSSKVLNAALKYLSYERVFLSNPD